MNKRMIVIGLLAVLALSLAGFAAMQQGWFGGGNAQQIETNGMPVPGVDDVEETIVTDGMPVPGVEGVEETIVTDNMPVPGLEDVEEMIVDEE